MLLDWLVGTPAGEFVSMAVPADGSYGINDEIIYSYPVTAKDGKYTIVKGKAFFLSIWFINFFLEVSKSLSGRGRRWKLPARSLWRSARWPLRLLALSSKSEKQYRCINTINEPFFISLM